MMTCDYNAMSDDAGIKRKSQVVLKSKTLSTWFAGGRHETSLKHD